jgi:hypothetical protein
MALRDAQPPVDADAVWPDILRRIRRGRRRRRGLASLLAMAMVVIVVGVVVRQGNDSVQIDTAVDHSPTVNTSTPLRLPTTAPTSSVPVEVAYDTSQGFDFRRVGRVRPDRVVDLGDNTIAVEWTSGCNQPAAKVTINQRGRTQIELLVGTFVVIDCTGEPSRWYIVVPTATPLAAEVVAVGPDDKYDAIRVERLEGVTRTVVRDELFTPASNLQYTSILGGSRRFDNRCSRVRITRITTATETFHQIEQADNPLADCGFAPHWVPFPQ